MTRFRTLVLATSLAFGIGAMAAVALAQDGAAMGEYSAAMQKMMQGSMDMKSSGDADVDFVRMMIPHHQAAVDMAKSQLKYGKDPEIRKLSEDIIAAQNKEIAQMNAWLAKHQK